MRYAAAGQTPTYLTNLSDAAWVRLEPLVQAAHAGPPRQHCLRTIGHALRYVVRSGFAGYPEHKRVGGNVATPSLRRGQSSVDELLDERRQVQALGPLPGS